MRVFLFKKLFEVMLVLFIVSSVVFVLVYIAGDPVALMLPDGATQNDIEALRTSLGLNDPFILQYFRYIGDLLQGSFGESWRYNAEALPIVLDRLPATFELAFFSLLVALLISVPLGVWSATKRNSVLDVFITGGSVLGKAMPNFWLGIMLILLLSVTYQVFPVSGRGTYAHIVLPAITMGTGIASEMTRLLRSKMIDILSQDYIRTAKSKGLRKYIVIYKHALKNGLNPVITILALQTSTVIGGALITETVFAWPGLGQLLVQAVYARDMAIVQASIFVVAFLVILMNLFADVIYRVVDPTIKYSKG
ncbi:ABC transporter permease [Virgibacillus sp. NKC19-3]|uniref:ABC transporter permease n=1 Tax=Virgibacillus saliphilus TaxID=2831674 RepID=UPI001C9B9C0B|nr:ABC transporter permease [Virgibacillus sp. NKC19-3]MBY7144583.1 ABC transporter permease [Virgibacillus sp. NKC19-3]